MGRRSDATLRNLVRLSVKQSDKKIAIGVTSQWSPSYRQWIQQNRKRHEKEKAFFTLGFLVSGYLLQPVRNILFEFHGHPSACQQIDFPR